MGYTQEQRDKIQSTRDLLQPYRRDALMVRHLRQQVKAFRDRAADIRSSWPQVVPLADAPGRPAADGEPPRGTLAIRSGAHDWRETSLAEADARAQAADKLHKTTCKRLHHWLCYSARGLTMSQYDVLVLRYVQGLSWTEICACDDLGLVDVRGVKRLCNRALLQLELPDHDHPMTTPMTTP